MTLAAVTRSNTSLHWPLGNLAFLLLAPAVLFSVGFFLVPMSAIFLSSVDDGPAGIGFTLSHYASIVTDGYYWEILFRTIRISIYTTIAALLISYPAALYLYFSTSRWRQVFLLIAISPLMISVVVRTYGWIVVLTPNGALNAIIPGGLPFRLLHTELAIILGLVHVYVPVMTISLNAALTKIDKKLLSAAASLGAPNRRIFRDVLLPLSKPGVIGGCTIVFAIAMTAFATPVLLGGSQSKTMPYLIYQRVMLISDWHLGSALAIVLFVAAMICVFLLTRATRLLDARVTD